MKGIITFFKDLVDKGARNKPAESTPFGSVQFLLLFITALVTVAEQLGKFFGIVSLERFKLDFFSDYSFFIPPIIFLLLLIWCGKVIMQKKASQERVGTEIIFFSIYNFSNGQRQVAKIVLVFCLIMGPNSSVWAWKEMQPIKGIIHGNLLYEKGSGIKGLGIVLKTKDDIEIASAPFKTGTDGSFVIVLDSGISVPRTYKLVFIKDSNEIAEKSLSAIYETKTDGKGFTKSPHFFIFKLGIEK